MDGSFFMIACILHIGGDQAPTKFLSYDGAKVHKSMMVDKDLGPLAEAFTSPAQPDPGLCLAGHLSVHNTGEV